MKAAVYYKYGNPNVIQIEDRKVATLESNQVLVKVFASSVNYADYALLTGKPIFLRFVSGLGKPKNNVLGLDFSGIVEKVGADVEGIQIGDEVNGEVSSSGSGALSEYQVVNASDLVIKSKKISHLEGASLPLAAVTALQGLRDYGKIKEGMKVLVNGASGGVGSFAVQIAKSYGASVTAISSDSKLDAVKSLGPDHVINYKTTKLEDIKETYDLIFDCAAYQPFKKYKGLLSEKGTYIMVGGSMKELFKLMTLGSLMSKKTGKSYKNYLAKYSKEDGAFVNDLVASGQVKPLIYKTYKLDDTRKAFEDYKSRASYGKIIIDINND
jgi:NADPH:quinone reductase-like Zn-dependent oxidoreductase